jgi:hypothetical protein
VVLPFQLLFGAAGPLALSLYYDIAGSYDGIMVAMASLAALAAVLVQFVRDPTRGPAPPVHEAVAEVGVAVRR